VAGACAAPLFALVALRRGSITVAAGIPAYAKARADQLGVARNLYLAILLRNYLHGPVTLLRPLEVSDGKLKRVRMQCGLPERLRVAGNRASKRWKLPFSVFMECLILNDAEMEMEYLLIWPLNRTPKPELKL